jgi:hypothetical protein
MCNVSLLDEDDAVDNALHYAALEGDTEGLIELLAAATFPVNSIGRRLWSPLHYAANAGELTVCCTTIGWKPTDLWFESYKAYCCLLRLLQ